ncbi:MAG: 3-deoxy-7-phosphoheptulonate synthase [Myxococcota bacterium]
MIIVLRPEITREQAESLLARIEGLGLKSLHMPGSERTVLGAIGDERVLARLGLDGHPWVESLKPILSPYKLVSRELHPHDTIVRLGPLAIGGRELAVVAGPALVESAEQLETTATALQQSGAHAIFGGGFFRHTGPFRPPELGASAYPLLAALRKSGGLPVLSAVAESNDVERAQTELDGVLVESDDLANGRLLAALGQSSIPVLLRRSPSADANSLLLAAEAVFNAGNEQVVLVEAGATSLAAIPRLKHRSHLPVMAQPSPQPEWALASSRAAVAAGADGLFFYAHHDPAHAVGGSLAVAPQQLRHLVRSTTAVAEAVGRALP